MDSVVQDEKVEGCHRDRTLCVSGSLMLMPHTKKSLLSDYWTTEALTQTPIFGKFMSRDRFVSILRFVHFVDNLQGTLLGASDCVWKIHPILSN